MLKKSRGPEAAPMSSVESDSDGSSSSSEGKGLPSTPSDAVKKSAAQKKPTKPSANKGIDAGGEADDSDSDSQMAPEPSDDGFKQKKQISKPNSKVAASPTKTPPKRALPFEFDGDDPKKPKKERGEEVGADEEGKKSAIRRLWSDDDEIVLLKGILEYKENKGVDPMTDGYGFHNFIKKSVQSKVDRKQVIDKVRKLKRRYKNSVFKKKSFSAHEQRAFDLSTKIWGKDVDVEPPTTKSNMKPRTGSKAAASGDDVVLGATAKNGDVVYAKGVKEVETNDSQKADKEGSLWKFIGKASISMRLDENIVKVGLELCSEDSKTEIDNKWKQFYLEESDFFLRKLDLAREETRLISEALKSVGM